ncbi:MAG: hypothetical protein COA79_13955 [Planctomycetota bacterium]|nr:MAG: hypothetical protein COA79_13955 [Planctomycetota bacterium]
MFQFRAFLFVGLLIVVGFAEVVLAEDLNLKYHWESNKEIKDAVKERKGKTSLSKLAAKMKPGTWEVLECKRVDRLMVVATRGKSSKGKVKSYHIAGWTDDGHWDSREGQFLFMGFRKYMKFINYSDKKNEWTALPPPFTALALKDEPFKDPRTGRNGHVYTNNAFDQEKGVFYHSLNGSGITYSYDLKEKKWSKIDMGGYIEFFPGVGLLSFGRTKSKDYGSDVFVYDEKRKKKKLFAKHPMIIYHTMIRYNPFLHEMLFVGGNSHKQEAFKMDAKGKITKIADAPASVISPENKRGLSIRSDYLVVDPISGFYLVFRLNDLYEIDTVKNTWKKVEGFKKPWNRYQMPVPSAVPEYGVIMIVDKKTYVYKHNAPAFKFKK